MAPSFEKLEPSPVLRLEAPAFEKLEPLPPVLRREAPAFEELTPLVLWHDRMECRLFKDRAPRPDLKRVSPALGKLNLPVLRRAALGWGKLRQAV